VSAVTLAIESDIDANRAFNSRSGFGLPEVVFRGYSQVVFRRIAVIGLFLSGYAAFAQEAATLTVTVIDPSVAVVAGAKVTITDLQKGTVSQGETNENGFVAFNLLPPGEYSLDVESAGFDKFHVPHLVLQVRDRQTLQAALKLMAAAGTTVVVTSAAQPVSSDNAQGISVDQQYVQNLPANGRNAESLISMAPGITTAAGGKGDGGFNANGLRSNTNYYTMDGVSVNSGGSGGPGGGDWKWVGTSLQLGATVVQAQQGHGHGTGEPCPSCSCGRREAMNK